TVAGVHAVDAQNQRYAWLNTGLAPATEDGSTAADPAWWLLRTDRFDGETIYRVDVAGTAPRAPVPPGLPRLPGPGEFYASPALRTLLAATPADQLADRFPGEAVGTIGSSALPAPDSLLIVVGHQPEQLARQPGAEPVTSIMTTDPSQCGDCQVGIGKLAIRVMLSVVAAAILFPILMFIGTATRLTATRREQRFAAMRLVGATPQQISVVSAVESAVAAVAGTAAGFGLFAGFRPGLAAIPFTGEPFFPGDLSVGAVDVLLVVLGVPAGAVVATWLALRRVRPSPLGISRQVTPRPPRVWRLVPLAAGLGELAFLVGRRPETTNGQLAAYLSGFLLVLVGLVVAGPWLTMLGSRVLALRTRRPARLVAGRRLSDNPQAGFRAVSGLVVALFVTSVATGLIATVTANQGGQPSGTVAGSALTKTFWPEERVAGEPGPSVATIPANLRSIPGVDGVQVIHENPLDRPDAPAGRQRPGVIACAELARSPEFGSCPDQAAVATVAPDLIDHRDPSDRAPVWPGVDLTPERLQELPILSVVVSTDGSAAAVEHARTVLAAAYPAGRMPTTERELDAESARTLRQWQQLANVVILASLPIAGCSLAVNVAGGLADRKRPFSVLRLTGVPLGVLRRVVALESVVPLLLAALVATGLGFLTAQLFLSAQLDYSLHPPGVGYYLIVVAGLAVALGVIAATLPLLRRITGPETARNE
ncbi:MAG: ABC transporter permease, partial [Natronosporangium sp.]